MFACYDEKLKRAVIVLGKSNFVQDPIVHDTTLSPSLVPVVEGQNYKLMCKYCNQA